MWPIIGEAWPFEVNAPHYKSESIEHDVRAAPSSCVSKDSTVIEVSIPRTYFNRPQLYRQIRDFAI